MQGPLRADVQTFLTAAQLWLLRFLRVSDHVLEAQLHDLRSVLTFQQPTRFTRDEDKACNLKNTG